MGKKGSWLSTLKRFFTTSKDKKFDLEWESSQEKKNVKEGNITSFFPIHREPSSIEKILEETETENKRLQALSAQRFDNRKPSISTASSRSKRHHHHTHVHLSATKIQASYGGHMARKSYKVLRGLVRLQGMMRGQRVKEQTKNTIRCMQLLIKVQSQIQLRRIQMIERKTFQHQNQHISEVDMESTFSKWRFTNQPGAEIQEEWENSVLSKEEFNKRFKRKQECVMRRERAMTYAQSHQLMKAKHMSSYSPLTIWWSWFEKQIPEGCHQESQITNDKNIATSSKEKIPRLLNYSEDAMVKPLNHGRKKGSLFSGQTPTSAKQQIHSRTDVNKNKPLGNDNTLTNLSSCASTSTPSYMEPTISTRAKFRPEVIKRVESSSKKRFYFGLADKIGSMRWKSEKSSVKN